MDLKITPSGQTIVKPTALGPGANTDTKLLIYGLFQKGRVLAQDELHGMLDQHAVRTEPSVEDLCLLFIHPGAPNLISLRSAGTMPA